jgi:integrase
MAKRRFSKDGLWLRGRVWWTRIAGQQVTTGCKDREAARLWRARAERETAEPAYAASRRTTIDEMITHVLEDRRRARGKLGATLSEHTLEIYRVKLGHVARVLGWSTGIADITYDAVGCFVTKRESEGASQHTIHKELKALRFALRLEAERGAYIGNVDHVTRTRRFAEGYVPRKRHLVWEEIGRLIGVMVYSRSPERAQHVAWLIATAGRLGESYRAEMRDHDLDAWTVRMRGTKTAGADSVIAIAPAFRRLLGFAIAGRPETGPLFPRWLNVHRSLIIAAKNAGIERVSPNDLRRTHASLLRQAGVALEDIREVTRHESTRMLEMVYGRTNLAATERALSHVTWPELQQSTEKAE